MHLNQGLHSTEVAFALYIQWPQIRIPALTKKNYDIFYRDFSLLLSSWTVDVEPILYLHAIRISQMQYTEDLSHVLQKNVFESIDLKIFMMKNQQPALQSISKLLIR